MSFERRLQAFYPFRRSIGRQELRRLTAPIIRTPSSSSRAIPRFLKLLRKILLQIGGNQNERLPFREFNLSARSRIRNRIAVFLHAVKMKGKAFPRVERGIFRVNSPGNSSGEIGEINAKSVRARFQRGVICIIPFQCIFTPALAGSPFFVMGVTEVLPLIFFDTFKSLNRNIFWMLKGNFSFLC